MNSFDQSGAHAHHEHEQTDALVARYEQVAQTLSDLNAEYHQDAKLICVSKTKPAAMIERLYHACGQRDFGENYLQEALTKMHALSELDLCWHYIGHIQRNKTRDIAANFDWVHTLERDIVATRLNEQRPTDKPPLNVLIQLNIDNEVSKSGCQPEVLDALIDTVSSCERLVLRGLMVIPERQSDSAFVRTRQIFLDALARHDLPHWDTLSMGMSADMALAVRAGSSMVRVGTAIFGKRTYPS